MFELPVWQTIEQAFRLVWAKREDFVSLASLPVVVLAMLAILQIVILPSEIGDVMPNATESIGAVLTPGQIMTLILNTGVSIFLYVAFAVAWHRKVLLSTEISTVVKTLRWGARQWRYLLMWLTVSVIAPAPVIALILLATALAGQEGLGLVPPVLVAAILTTLFIYGRIVLLLPGAAVDRPLSIPASWSLTTGNGWRMVGIAFLPLLPVALVKLLVATILAAAVSAVGIGQGLSSTFVVALLQYAITYAGVAITISAVSLAYMRLTSRQPPNGSSTA